MRLDKLDRPVNLDQDHVLGPPDAELTLVELNAREFDAEEQFGERPMLTRLLCRAP